VLALPVKERMGEGAGEEKGHYGDDAALLYRCGGAMWREWGWLGTVPCNEEVGEGPSSTGRWQAADNGPTMALVGGAE
jgi:hypothetical protein